MTRTPRLHPTGTSITSAAVREAARNAAWVAGLYTTTSVVGAVLAAHRAGSLAVQAFVAEWGAGHLGVSWSDPEAPPLLARDAARRAAVGGLAGLGAAAFVLVFAGITRAATFSRWTVAPSELLVGLLVAAFAAVRDELILRGLVLRAFRHTLGAPTQLVVCGVVAAAARVGQLPDLSIGSLVGSASGIVSLVVAGLLGVCFATLWRRERGAFSACAAHTAWTFATTTAISGGLSDVTWGPSLWGGGSGAAGGLDGSLAVAVGLLLVTAAAVTLTRLGSRATARERDNIRA